MSTRFVSVMLFSAALLGSCAPLHPDIRPEVSRPLNEAMHLSGYWTPNRAAITAKLNQAVSVPNLNSAEQIKIRDTTIATLARVPRNGLWNIPGGQSGAPQGDAMPNNSLNNSGPLR